MSRISMIIGSLLLATAVAGAQPSAPDFADGKGPHAGIGADKAASESTVKMEPIDMIHFGFASSKIDAADRAQLESAARWLKANPDKRLVLEGHTDKIGRAAYNNWLAGKRANAVRNALVELGADDARMVVAVFGESVLSSTGNSANRRVAIYGAPLEQNVVVGEVQ